MLLHLNQQLFQLRSVLLEISVYSVSLFQQCIDGSNGLKEKEKYKYLT